MMSAMGPFETNEERRYDRAEHGRQSTVETDPWKGPEPSGPVAPEAAEKYTLFLVQRGSGYQGGATRIPRFVRARIVTDSVVFGAVAQLGERITGSDEVRGSNPLSSTIFLPL